MAKAMFVVELEVPPDALSRSEAREILGYDDETIGELLDSRNLECVDGDEELLITRDSLVEYVYGVMDRLGEFLGVPIEKGNRDTFCVFDLRDIYCKPVRKTAEGRFELIERDQSAV